LVRGTRAAKEAPEKKLRYGRFWRQRRRGAVLLALLLLVIFALPFVLKVPETVRRITHPLKYEETIRSAAQENSIEPALVAAVILKESRFNPEAESLQGAYGLMQIRPETARFISERSGIWSDYRYSKANIRMGTWYLGYLQYRYHEDERLVLAAYNSGEGQVDAWHTDENFDINHDIPFKETQEYVENVLEARDTYVELYGRELDRR
jgi:soluble lytic murein transglycosylase